MNSQFNSLIASINREVAATEFGSNPAELYEPIRYIMDLGGKRMRPLLTVLSFGLFKDDLTRAIPPAISVEVFHNFTLMHDDIMDVAPIRRGQPTVHEKWNSNVAILSGDVMLVKAYEKLMQVEDRFLKPVLTAFNQCATEVCEGQQLDMNFETRQDVTVEEYLAMIRQKTAVLLGFSLQLGAILGEADDNTIEALKDVGINLGLGFQLKDDLLDVFGDQEKFGKKQGGDIAVNKKTYLLIKALETADDNSKSALLNWINNDNCNEHEKIEAVTKLFSELDIKELTQQQVDSYFDTAFTSLHKTGIANDRLAPLRSYAELLINRES